MKIAAGLVQVLSPQKPLGDTSMSDGLVMVHRGHRVLWRWQSAVITMIPPAALPGWPAPSNIGANKKCSCVLRACSHSDDVIAAVLDGTLGEVCNSWLRWTAAPARAGCSLGGPRAVGRRWQSVDDAISSGVCYSACPAAGLLKAGTAALVGYKVNAQLQEPPPTTTRTGSNNSSLRP